jgi:hypothetical protein
MAMALELHREMDAHARVTPIEREMRRRLFWTCYLLDRFMASGSKRPALVSDRTILLRLPCWSPNPGQLPVEGEFFQYRSNLQYMQGSGGKKPQGSSGMLIDIARILGTTNRYLAAGGVKGDSHFPWHSLSNLSKIRHDLDVWASGTDDVFASLDTLFGQPDSTILVLSKLIYHLIHCLVYRPFLPIDLAELAGSGQHQSWQIEATNMCFLHANAIAELVELGKQTAMIEWPAFVGYCICTAGTVHIHGTHYNKNSVGAEMSVFASSPEFLSREMQQLSELRYAWASVQHQRETLQGIFNAHSELVKSISNNPTGHAPVFHLEDFFDRYANIGGPGGQTFDFDAANLSLSDVVVDFAADAYMGHDLYAPRTNGMPGSAGDRASAKRKRTAPPPPPLLTRRDSKGLAPLATNSGIPQMPHSAHSLPTPSLNRPPLSAVYPPPPASALLPPTAQSGTMHDIPEHDPRLDPRLAGHGVPVGFPAPQPEAHMASLTGAATPFSPPGYNFAVPATSTQQQQHANRPETPLAGPTAFDDPMFGTVPTNAFGSPAAWEDESKGAGAGAGQVPETPGSTATGTATAAEEKDPFLSLLEELAESEGARGPGGGSELDFFLAGAPAT